MRQIKTPQQDWARIDEACLMSCRHRADIDQAEYNDWLEAKHKRDAQEVRVLIGIMLVPFILLTMMCIWSLHTNDWGWLE